jgi:N-acetylmuramoyl-L-alanine amidase
VGDYWVVEAADVLREAGLVVDESGPCAGWQTRSRSSGGFPFVPLGVVWHHTASNTDIDNDLAWQINGSDDAPIGNATIDRDGVVHMIAAGAANTAGKGGPITFSRGTCELDKGNTSLWNFEVCNSGVGEPWPVDQLDAYFAASNAMNAYFGNVPGDIVTHAGYTEPSCPGRKIDPATAAAVTGPWQPRALNASGTWSQDDVRAECARRAHPPEPEDDEVTDDDIERIAQRAAQLVWHGPKLSTPSGDKDAGTVLEWIKHDTIDIKHGTG